MGLHWKCSVAKNHCQPLWDHCVRHHGARAGKGAQGLAQLSMQVTGIHKTAARRLISEAVQIDDEVRKSESSRLVLNSISQWFQPKLIQVRANTGLIS